MCAGVDKQSQGVGFGFGGDREGYGRFVVSMSHKTESRRMGGCFVAIVKRSGLCIDGWSQCEEVVVWYAGVCVCEAKGWGRVVRVRFQRNGRLSTDDSTGVQFKQRS